MKYKAVILDLFGTLIDNLSPEEYERILAEMANALSMSAQDFCHLWWQTLGERMAGSLASVEDTLAHICQALRAEAGDGQLKAATQIKVDYVRRALRPRPEAVEVLTELKARGYKTGLISDCAAAVPLLWAETPFAMLVDAAVFSCSAGMCKPDPRIYHLACERLEVAPGDCLYIGDGTSRELTGAAKVGMHPVLISVPYDNNYDHFRVDAQEWQGKVVSSLKQILNAVG